MSLDRAGMQKYLLSALVGRIGIPTDTAFNSASNFRLTRAVTTHRVAPFNRGENTVHGQKFGK